MIRIVNLFDLMSPVIIRFFLLPLLSFWSGSRQYLLITYKEKWLVMRALDHVETERKVKFNNMKVQREQSTVVKQLQGKRAFKLMFLIN